MMLIVGYPSNIVVNLLVGLASLFGLWCSKRLRTLDI